MFKRVGQRVAIFLIIVLIVRFAFALTAFNNDTYNHFAWMDSVSQLGWKGLYERDVSPWADVNYPPLTLYSFSAAEKLYHTLPLPWQTVFVHAALYKLPSLLTDVLLALLVWLYVPLSRRQKYMIMAAILLNPALAYNSVWWGQVESFATFFAIASLLALTRRQAEWGIVWFGLALLAKQTSLPLLPVVLYGIWISRPRPWRMFAAGALVAGATIIAYQPLTPAGVPVPSYALQTYLDSLRGQPHQWEATVNALNAWYAWGLNHTPDSHTLGNLFSVRQLSLMLVGLGTLASLYLAHRLRRQPYVSLVSAAAFLSLWTFMFATRMHERHSYMAVLLLTLYLPLHRSPWPYLLLSGLSFFNLYAVWREWFVVLPGNSAWDMATVGFALGGVVVTLLFLLWSLRSQIDLRSQNFRQHRVKT